MQKNIASKQYYQYLLFTFLLFSLGSCTGNSHKKQKHQEAPKNGMVVSAHPEATKIGVEILEKGGNAVDVACAVELSLAVCYPVAGNIGGGGFMVMRMADGKSYSLDYREKAPRAATKDMYLDQNGNVISGLSTYSHLAVGVPGTIDGVLNAHTQFGKLDFKEIIQPAIDIAQKGFPITKKQAERLNNYKEVFEKTNGNSIAFIKSETWLPGDTLKQADLAHTLSLIRDNGRAGFYAGETARKIVKQMSENTGLISLSDLEDYSSAWRDPIVGNYKAFKVISMPPPSSGGVALMQLLGMVEPYPIKNWGWQNFKTIHLMVEAERRVYADRAEFLGDPDFYKVPVKELLDKQYLEHRMDDFSNEKAGISKTIKHGTPIPVESEETTHYSIADGWGIAVSGTTTLNRGYGSKIVVSGAGFFLNNEMDDFSSKPGHPNSFGLVGGEANSIQPGKRMLSSMTPTILEKDGKLFMVVGSPGGSTIITSVFQTILNVVEHGMNMQEAVTAPRFHSQWLPDQVSYEKNGFSDSLKLQLEEMGHYLKERSSIGRVDAILRKADGSLEGGADPRGDDTAGGTKAN